MTNYHILNNGNKIPSIGFGTYKITDENQVYSSLEYAFKYRYQLIDTAYFYDNEKYIGNYLKNIPRKDYMIATKVWPEDFGYDNTLKSVERSLKSLNVDYVDIMYLHWPGDDMEDSYKALERCFDEKMIKNLALANFLPKHYEKIAKLMNIKPVLNQLEVHPLMTNKKNIDYFQKEDIKIVSWSPLARMDNKIMEDEDILNLAQKYDKTPAQIVLRWHMEKNLIPIPKSTKEDRIAQNIDIYDFKLEEDQIKVIDDLDEDRSVSQKPDDESWLKKLRYGL